MRIRLRLSAGSLALLLFAVASVNASPITFASRAAFDLAAPGLPIETFEAGSVFTPGSGGTVCGSPVNEASTCIPGLLPGVTFVADETPNPFDLITLVPNAVVGGLPIGNSTKVFGPLNFTDTLDVTFAQANAVGFDFYPGPTAGSVQISLFDAMNMPIALFAVAAPVGPTFFGVVSPDGLIRSVNIASQTATPGELIDNLAFGEVATVPEPASLILVGTGVTALYFRKRRHSARG